MSSHLSLKIRLGPLVSLEVGGNNCHEILDSLKGFDELNEQLEAICSDLAERVYPEGEAASEEEHGGWATEQDKTQEQK
jgi:hypothetical protein